MSFWRKKQIADEVAKTVDPSDYGVDRTDALPDPTVKPDNEFAKDCIYTIGKNQSGNTQLKVKMDYGYSTITMSPEAVVEMIKMLAVTIDGKYDVSIESLKDITEA